MLNAIQIIQVPVLLIAYNHQVEKALKSEHQFTLIYALLKILNWTHFTSIKLILSHIIF